MRLVFPVLFAISMIAISCTLFEEEEASIGFDVNVSELSCESSSSLRSVIVRSGTKWSVTNMPSWMSLETINSVSGSPYEWTAIFSAEANDNYDREGQIVINANTESAEITVHQEGKKGKYVAVESVSISPSELNLTEGESSSLSYSVSPSNASVKDVSWKSDAPSVATVTDVGEVKALSVGKALITVTTEDGGRTASCDVVVKTKEIPVESISLDKKHLAMRIGDTYTLAATVLPSNATNRTVSWTSSNSKVATVSSSGIITAKGFGETTIEAVTADGGFIARCVIGVYTPIQDLNISMPATLTISEGEFGFLYVSIDQSIESNQIDPLLVNLSKWTVEDASIIQMDASGPLDAVFKALSVGTTKVTNTLRDSYGSRTLSCIITVAKKTVPVTGVSLDKTSLSMTEGDTQTLTATVSPSDATDKSVTWSSSDTSVATVSTIGVVTAKAAGSATITAITVDGGFTATCSVLVTTDPYGAVDLGLSVKWASFNYGASSITAPGGYFFYGDSTGNAMIYSFTPPNVNSISGTQYDIVRRNWGGNWRIPTRSEINELYSLCTWTSTTLNGVSVLKVTGPSGASIYLPFTGCAFPADGPIGTTQIYDGNNAYLMSDNSYGDSNGRFVYVYYFTPSGQRNSVSYRADFIKFPIRPVR